MIVVLGGTVDARELFFRLKEAGLNGIISVTSIYGEQLLDAADAQVHRGRLDTRAMVNLLQEKGPEFLVDATHPYALEASRSAMEAARENGVTYVRLERARTPLPHNNLIKIIDNPGDFADFFGAGEVVFSTLGSKHLAELMPAVAKKGAHLVARVLPVPAVVKKCLRLGLTPADIVAVQGPFSRELNRELYRCYGANLVLTKESGAEGGQEAKIQAALDLGIKVVVWRRPRLNYPRVFNSAEEVCAYLLHSNCTGGI